MAWPDLDADLLTVRTRTVPTKDDILVPETLLKKRKSQEKAREERLAQDARRKAVSAASFFLLYGFLLVMQNTV